MQTQTEPQPRGRSSPNAPAAARALRASPYPSAVGRVVLAAAGVSTHLWDRALGAVERVQREALRDIVTHAAGTEFGRAHGFSRAMSYEDFARSVPLGDYDSHSPAIERMRKGERGLLVPEFVRYYGNSSGSSFQGKSKFLPITERQIRHQQRAGSEILMRYLAWARDRDFSRGYVLGLFPPTTMREEGPVLITSNPGLMVNRFPLATRPLILPSKAHRRIVDYDEKLTVVAESYLDHDVRGVTGTTCWFPLFFERVLAAARKRGSKARSVSDIWPNLRVLVGGGVSAEPYLPIIHDLFGREITLIDTYNATEGGIYGASDCSARRGMLMIPHRGTFFELVPLEEIASPSPTRVPLWAAERDRPYAIVVTTTSGLYAYKLGDIVRLTETQPPRIEFMGRLSGCLSVTQELTTHVEIERAVAHAARVAGGVTLDFGAGAEVGASGARSRYVLFVEFQEPPSDLEAFARAFDEGVCLENRVYREHRKGDVAILPARVLALARGGAHRFMAAVTRGNVQGKFPRIMDESRVKMLYSYASEHAV